MCIFQSVCFVKAACTVGTERKKWFWVLLHGFSVIMVAQISLSLHVPGSAWNLCPWCSSAWGKSGCVARNLMGALEWVTHVRPGKRAWGRHFAYAEGLGKTPSPKPVSHTLLWLRYRLFRNCSIRILRGLFLPENWGILKHQFIFRNTVGLCLLPPCPSPFLSLALLLE